MIAAPGAFDFRTDILLKLLRFLARDIAEKDGIRLSAGIYRFDGSGWVAD